jgi:hypothetical protein
MLARSRQESPVSPRQEPPAAADRTRRDGNDCCSKNLLADNGVGDA